jgi:hypothetical protein
VYERALARIEIMDRTGYDAVWLAEHHFTGYSVCPSVHVMAAHIAARTTNLRIGTAVTLAAFYHPLRIAEEVALLDVLTGGRINWGAGRGFDPREFAIFDVPARESADRFREAVEIVLAAWTNDKLDFHGRFQQYEGVEVLPKPRQQPKLRQQPEHRRVSPRLPLPQRRLNLSSRSGRSPGSQRALRSRSSSRVPASPSSIRTRGSTRRRRLWLERFVFSPIAWGATVICAVSFGGCSASAEP